MLLQSVIGNETFSEAPNASLDIKAMYRAKPTSQLMDFAAAIRDPRSECRTIGAIERLPASARSERHGTWVMGRYNVPEGSLVRIDFKRRRARELTYTLHKVVLNMRETAALRQLRLPYTGHPHASQVCGYWEGRFDILTPDLFELMRFDPGLYESHYTPMGEGDWYTETILEPETFPLTRVNNAVQSPVAGATPRVIVPRPLGTRKLTLKRDK